MCSIDGDGADDELSDADDDERAESNSDERQRVVESDDVRLVVAVDDEAGDAFGVAGLKRRHLRFEDHCRVQRLPVDDEALRETASLELDPVRHGERNVEQEAGLPVVGKAVEDAGVAPTAEVRQWDEADGRGDATLTMPVNKPCPVGHGPRLST